MKLGLRLFVHAMPLAVLAGCNVPANDQNENDAPSLAQQACDREDVQDVVGKEVKAVLYKGWFEHAGVALLLIDPREIGEQFKQARASFHDVAAEAGPNGNSMPISRVVCHGILQVDDSNEIRGQSILQLRKLRWSINFGQPVNNPQTSAFSIVLDRGSLAEDVRVNGEPIEALRRRDDDTPTPSTQPSNGARGEIDAEGQAQARRDAANEAEATTNAVVKDAEAAAAQVERELQAELAK